MQLCDDMNGQLHTVRAWHILRAIMGHRKPRNTLKKLMLSTGATVKDLIGEIRDTFYPDETQTMAQQLPTAETRLDREVQTAQESEEIKGIDSDFTDAELQTALFQLKRNTAPGPDKITYGMLRNIPDNKLDELLRHINEVWATGELPEEWKEAHVIMLPKPGKLPNTPANLRPISKTSCMGKLMEKMALNRLEWHLEATNQLAHTLVGFRKHVSTQDVAKMIKEQVYDNPSTVQQRTIVAVDLKRAFDNVTHEAILRNLRETNPGNRMYRYVKNFLKDRTVRILDPEGQPSEPYPLCRGTPQGSILSPMLFNITMKNLPTKLNAIPNLHHAIYADDISIWCTTGNPGQQEETIQTGLNIIHEHANAIGLQCSPDKSEYVVVINHPRQKMAEEQRKLMSLHIGGTLIPRRPAIKILGFIWQQDGKSTEWTAKTVKQLNQIYNMIARITRYNRGMKEHELRKIVEATAYSRVMYSYPYTQLTQTQKRKIKAVLRKCHRLELGTPKYAATALVNATAIHNTLEEKSEIQQEAQRHRLTTSQQGRKILSSLGYSTERLPEIPTPPPPWESIPHLTVRPIPKHMHPEVDSERRKSRATHLKDPCHDIYYTDASFTNSNATTASVGPKGHVVRRHANVPSVTAAEIQAIAEAATLHSHTTNELTIRTDSQDALRAYAKNDLPEHILGLLTQYMTNHPHLRIYLEWVPGHQAIEGNERAHALSRDNTEPSVPIGWPQAYDPREDRAEQRKKRRTFLKEMREEQRKFPTPLHSTPRRQATFIRQAQTNSLPCDMTLHYIHNLGGLPRCQVCGAQPPDNRHTYWECPRAQNSPYILGETQLPLHIPHTWESWAAPPQDLQATLWKQLQNHVEHVLGLTSCNNNEHAS